MNKFILLIAFTLLTGCCTSAAKEDGSQDEYVCFKMKDSEALYIKKL